MLVAERGRGLLKQRGDKREVTFAAMSMNYLGLKAEVSVAGTPA